MGSRFPSEGCIYGLGEPIVYVGQAKDAYRRYREHLRSARLGDGTAVHLWMRYERWPKLTILETNPVDGLDAAERRWIAKLTPKLNATDGGTGGMSGAKAEVREKMGRAAVGRARKKSGANSNSLKRAQTIAMRACGNPDWRKCGICKQYDAPENLVRKTSGGHVHVACRQQQDQQRRSK